MRRALLGLCCLLGGIGAADEPPVHVGAYYYPWYDAPDRHWDLGYAGEGPRLGKYSSRSAEVIRQHLDWSREFGIDSWICSWWGTDSWEDETLRRFVVPALESALANGEPTPRFCLFYESEGLLGLDPETGIEFDESTTTRFLNHFRYLADHYFSSPAYLRIEGKPVVYLYLSRAFAGGYARALLRARAVGEARGFSLFLVGDEIYWGEPDADRIAALDAITAYNLHGPEIYAGLKDWNPFIKDCDDLYRRYREVASGSGTLVIPGIIPGFDTRGRHYFIPRFLSPDDRSTGTLEALSRVALRHVDPRFPAVTITSFNEWHEGTQVEPDATGDRSAGDTLRQLFKSPAR